MVPWCNGAHSFDFSVGVQSSFYLLTKDLLKKSKLYNSNACVVDDRIWYPPFLFYILGQPFQHSENTIIHIAFRWWSLPWWNSTTFLWKFLKQHNLQEYLTNSSLFLDWTQLSFWHFEQQLFTTSSSPRVKGFLHLSFCWCCFSSESSAQWKPQFLQKNARSSLTVTSLGMLIFLKHQGNRIWNRCWWVLKDETCFKSWIQILKDLFSIIIWFD